MSGIGFGALLALLGVMLFGAHQPEGLIAVVVGFVSIFSGMASQQEKKQLQAAQAFKQLPSGTEADRSVQRAEDEYKAAEVYAAPQLPILPVSIPLHPGEHACHRESVNFTDVGMLPSLRDGRPVDMYAATSEDGDLYVTNRKVYFSGARMIREIPFHEIASVSVGPGAVEIFRRGRPRPALVGTPYPAALAATIERARSESPASMQSPILAPPMRMPSLGVPGAATIARAPSETAPSYITCSQCGAANGLSANFCQNCAAPITAGSTPTLMKLSPEEKVDRTIVESGSQH